MVQGQGFTRTAANRQMESIPTFNSALKFRKYIRLNDNGNTFVPPISAVNIDTTTILSNIRSQCGLNATYNTTVTIHAVRVFLASRHTFGATPTAHPAATLKVAFYDIEESGGSLQREIARFSDVSSLAGVAHISGFFAVNNRPTFDFASPAVRFMQVIGSDYTNVYIDLDCTIIHANNADLTIPTLLTLDTLSLAPTAPQLGTIVEAASEAV